MTTFAGGSPTGPGDGGAASLAFLNKPTGVSLAKDGSLIIVDQGDHRVRKVTTNGIISTIAGSGIPGYQDGAAAQAQFNFPEYAKVDANGNVFVTEVVGHRLRKIDTSGNVTTVAGTGTDGDSGDGGPATSATFHQLYGVTVDGGGNIFVADSAANRVRRINTQGQIATIVGNGTPNFTGDGTTFATLNSPLGLAFDTNVNALYIADSGNGRIRKVDFSNGGVVTTFAGCSSTSSTCLLLPSSPTPATSLRLVNPQDVTIGPDGVYILDQIVTGQNFFSVTYRIDNSGTATIMPGLQNGGVGTSLAVVSQTQMYVTEIFFSRTVQLVTGSGPRTYAGGGTLDGVPALSAGVVGSTGIAPLTFTIALPAGIKTDNQGNAYFSDYGQNRVRKVDAKGVITTIAGNGLLGSSGDGSSGALAAVAGPLGIDFDTAGNLYIAESQTNKIRKVTPAGVISTFAGTGSAGFSGDGGAATKAALNNPTSVAVDNTNNVVYIVDNGNNRIRKVDASGNISTYAGITITNNTLCNQGSSISCGDNGPAAAASLGVPVDAVVDASANLYVLERCLQISTQSCITGSRIRKIDTSGKITTIAGNGLLDASGEGNNALSASLGVPSGLAIDKNSGNLFVADDRNSRIMRVAGTVSRLVGTGINGFNGDGQAGTSTQITRPQGLAIDGGGNLLFWDAGNNRIRKVSGVGIANPRKMVVVSGDRQSATVNQPLPNKLTVSVLDGVVGVAGIVVTFNVDPPGAATVTPASATTDQTGSASTQVTVGSTASAFTVTAVSIGLTSVVFNESSLAAINANGAVQGATFTAVALAPGTITSLFGIGMATGADAASSVPLPTTLSANTQIKIVGTSSTLIAPLYYVSPTQINFQFPFEVTDRTVQIIVNAGGNDSPPLGINVGTSSPGIFTVSQTGSGLGSVLHGVSGAPVNASNPAVTGEIVSIYCTGLGSTNPFLASGAPANGGLYYANAGITVSIGGQLGTVDFAGLAPGFVGLYQINVRVPSGLATASAVPLFVTALGNNSNTVTIPVTASRFLP